LLVFLKKEVIAKSISIFFLYDFRRYKKKKRHIYVNLGNLERKKGKISDHHGVPPVKLSHMVHSQT
jgi:uncharacterized protein YlbG (UPF0298 family)